MIFVDIGMAFIFRILFVLLLTLANTKQNEIFLTNQLLAPVERKIHKR